jgi:ribosomal protein L23
MDIIIRPIVTEKMNAQADGLKYGFIVIRRPIKYDKEGRRKSLWRYR